MSLQVPAYTAPQFADPVVNAYAWIGGLALDFTNNSGRIVVLVNYDAASALAGRATIDSFGVTLGEVLVPAAGATPAVTFPDLPTLLARAAAAQQANPALDPFGALREAIYQALMTHPRLAGATEVA